MKKTVLTCLTVLCTLFVTYAQSETAAVTGSVQDEKGEAVSFATVVLLQASDSAMAKADYSEEDGTFTIPGLEPGDYFLRVTSVGLENYSGPVFNLVPGQTYSTEQITMQTLATELDEITVKAKKPLVEVRPDKTVFNVESSINATGTDALELLRKAPGVIVDNNENIMLLGKSGVRIFIDGKPSPMRGEDLAQFLKSMQSDQIEAIEIITNPSAKYEAEGNAGIINIKLKKDKRLGTNGSVVAGFREGVYPKYNGSLSLNHRNKQLNLFGRYGYYNGTREEFINLFRQQTILEYDQRSTITHKYEGHNLRGGIDFFLNDKSTIGVLVDGNISDRQGGTNSFTSISTIGRNTVDSVLISLNERDSERDNLNVNLNYQFKGKNGQEFNLDADYGLYRNEALFYQPNVYLDPTEEIVLSERNFINETPTDIDIYTFKGDYEQEALGGKLGAGFKLSLVETDNTLNFYNVVDGDEFLDEERSNRFVYKENVNAAYVTYQRKLSEKWNLQLGLRAEHTNSTGELTSTMQNNDNAVDIDRLDLFPTVGATFSPSQKHQFVVSYSRRVDRPNYQDLNPFEYRLDELTFQKGNPFLKPQFTNSFQIGHTFNYRLNTTINYSHTTDFFSEITDTLDSRTAFLTTRNIADRKNLSLNVSYPFQVTEWWSVFANVSVYYMDFEASFENGAKPLDVERTSYNFYAQQTFSLPEGISLEVSGWYSGPSVWGGTFYTKRMGAMDIGLQKKVLDDKGTLRVSLTDVFLTNRWAANSDFGGLQLHINGGHESRQLRLNFTYNFGNEQVKKSRRRKTGLEDEQRRIKSE